MTTRATSKDATTTSAEGRRVRSGGVRERALQVGLFASLVVIWHFAVIVFEVPGYILPAPLDIAERVIQDVTDPGFYMHVRTTLTEILAGFGIAAMAGISIGFAVVSIPLLERVLTPYIVAFQTMPKIALAPLAIIWLGYGISAKVVLAALIAFFPIFVNVVAGFKSIDADQILLMRSIEASPTQIFIKLRMHAVLPYLMAGLDIGIIFAVIGSVVVEFIGSATGLGSLIIQRQAQVDVAGTMSVLIVLSAIGIAFHVLLMLVSKSLTSWADQRATIAP